jgi:hypothetical protein
VTADGPVLCDACQDRPTPRHEDCDGWCECPFELLIEAEEAS